MPEDIAVIGDSPTSSEVALGPHALNGRSDELLHLVGPIVETAERQEVVLHGEDAEIVTLEGIATLARLRMAAERSGVQLVMVDLHPALERRLQVTGLLGILSIR